jgi:thiol:disulfide interchange protein
MKNYLLLSFIILFSFIFGFSQGKDTVKAAPIFGYYNPKADPEAELKKTIDEATKNKKRILLDVGGEWCIWCHRLDDFFVSNPDVTEYLKKNFVLLKVNFSKENDNEVFLKKFPKVAGYPHIFVLDTDGKFLHSQDTGKLEKDKGHDREKVLEFLKQWSVKE